MSYILFYSDYCVYSSKFINILEKSGQASFFVKICVDKVNGERPSVVSKYTVTEVPTVITDNKKIAGYASFKWLKTLLDQDQVPSVSAREPKQNIKEITNHVKPENIQAFDSGFMSTFSNLKEISSSQQDSGAIAPPQDVSIPEDTSFSNDKLKAKQFENEYNNLKKSRDLDIPQPSQRM